MKTALGRALNIEPARRFIKSSIFAASATFLLFTPAIAQGPDAAFGPASGNIVIGKVTSVDKDGKTISVEARDGQQTIKIDADAKVLKQKTITVADIKIGDIVRINGSRAGLDGKTIYVGDISGMLPNIMPRPFGMFGGPNGRPQSGEGPNGEIRGPFPGGGPNGEMQGPPPPGVPNGGMQGPPPPGGGQYMRLNRYEDESAKAPMRLIQDDNMEGPPPGGPEGGMGQRPAFGGGGGMRMAPPPGFGGPQGLKGKVTSLKPLTLAITEDLSLVIKTSASTKVYKAAPASISSIIVGDRVVAKGTTGDDGIFVAKTLGVNIMPARPEGMGGGFGGNRPSAPGLE